MPVQLAQATGGGGDAEVGADNGDGTALMVASSGWADVIECGMSDCDAACAIGVVRACALQSSVSIQQEACL
eukprot:3886592-Prymnesium_polylepis.1